MSELNANLPEPDHLDGFLDEIEDLLEDDPEAFVSAYVQHEGNGGAQYWALLDALLDRHGPDAVIRLAEILAHPPRSLWDGPAGGEWLASREPHLDPWAGADQAPTSYWLDRVASEVGTAVARAIAPVADLEEFCEILSRFAATIGPNAPIHEMDPVQAEIRQHLRQGNLADAKRSASVLDEIPGWMIEFGHLLSDDTPQQDQDLQVGLRLWQMLAATNDDFELVQRAAKDSPDPSTDSEEERHRILITGSDTSKPLTLPMPDHFASPQAKGGALEQSTLELFERFFAFEQETREETLEFLRRQTSGSQFGHDLAFIASSRRYGISRCHVECKFYQRTIRTDDIAAKLMQAELYWAETQIDHWILISPHSGISNELELMSEMWNANNRFPFTVQLWTPDNFVDTLFEFSPAVYEVIYPNRELPDRSEDERAAYAHTWTEALRPRLRVPDPLERYLRSSEEMCLPGEPVGDFLGLIEEHVVPRAADERGTPLNGTCERQVRDWLARRDEPTLILTGEFGDGKSFFTFLLCHRLAGEFRDDPRSGWFPLRLPLKMLRSAGSARNLLANRLADIGSEVGEWEQLRRRTSTLVILDGLDEITPGLDPETVSENLRLIEDCVNQFEGAKILITTRSGFLDRGREAERLADRLGHPRRLRLSAVSRLHRVQHLNQYAERLGLRGRVDQLRRLYDPIGLAAKPLFLQMIKATIESLPTDRFDEVTLYETYIDQSLTRKIELLRDPRGQVLDSEIKKNLHQLLEIVAWRMYISGMDHLDLVDLDDHLAGGLAGLLWKMGTSDATTTASPGDVEARVGVRSLLRPMPGDQDRWPVAFFHRSMHEYFVAAHVSRAVKGGVVTAQECLTTSLLGQEITDFASALLTRDDYLQQHVATLLSVARGSVLELPGLGGGAAVTLLYQLAGELPGRDWAGLCLDGCSLPGADLSGKSFTGSSLRHAVLDNANLEDADLSMADLTGVRIEDTAGVTALALFNGTAYVAYDDRTVRSWRRTGPGNQWISSVLFRRATDSAVAAIYMTDGGLLYLIGRFIEVWDVAAADGQMLQRYRVRSDVSALNIRAGGEFALFHEEGSGAYSYVMINPLTRVARVVSTGHYHALGCFDGDDHAVLSSASEVKVQEAGSAVEVHIDCEEHVTALDLGELLGDSLVLVGTARGTVEMHSWPQTEDGPDEVLLTSIAQLHRGMVSAVALEADSAFSGGTDGVVAVSTMLSRESDGPVMEVVACLTLGISCSGLRFDGVHGPNERAMLERLVS